MFNGGVMGIDWDYNMWGVCLKVNCFMINIIINYVGFCS